MVRNPSVSSGGSVYYGTSIALYSDGSIGAGYKGLLSWTHSHASKQRQARAGVPNAYTYHYAPIEMPRALDRPYLQPYYGFQTMDEAAIHFGMLYNGASIADNWEYGTRIYSYYEEESKYYSYDTPTIGDIDNVFINSGPSEIDGIIFVSSIHTHASYMENYRGSEFSPADLKSSKIANRLLNGYTYTYLVTPKGELLRHDPRTNVIDTISTNMPYDPRHPDRK